MIENDTYTTRTWGCELCQQERRVLSWNYDPTPVCCQRPMVPGGGSRATLQIITDDVPGGFTVHNGFSRATTFYSKRAHRQALSANGFKLAEKGECGF